jgi:phosphoribosyl 1,2-cyclic phosphodiesterase
MRAVHGQPGLSVKFWGVRGSIPTPSVNNLGYGGNTPCIEVRSDNGVMAIDGGTGARKLGMHLQEKLAGKTLKLHLLLTHFHWDHIQGLPFFMPLYSAENEICFRSGRPPEQVKEVLEGQMSSPYFPVGFERLAARRSFVDSGSQMLQDLNLSVHAFPLNHPQSATGYRIEMDGRVITHASDVEHGDKRLDFILRDYAHNSDVLIYDAQYTPEEYESKRGWGHSTWLEATRISRDCGVKRLVLFHHDPSHDDEKMDQIVEQARSHFDNTDAAREGWEIVL